MAKSSVRGIARTALLLAVVVIVLGRLPATRGHDHSPEQEHLLQNDSRQNGKNESQGFPSMNQKYPAKYFKCRCEGNQAWNGSGCVDTQTKVIVVNPDTKVTLVSLTDDFAGVTVRNVQCSWDHVRVDLDPQRYFPNDFALLPNGSLWWQEREYEHYCIDHTLESWEAQVCLPPPAVPRCCLQGPGQTQDGSLCTDDAYQFSPSVMIGEEFEKWPQVTPVADRKCKQTEKVISLPLNTGKAHLSYKSGAVSIVWTPYYIEETQEEGFCVRLQEGGGYVATICQEDQEAIYQNSCRDVTCVRKCCPAGHIHLETEVHCIAAESETQLWKPTFVDADLLTNVTPPENLTLLYGRPQCDMYQADPFLNENDKFYLLKNGNLYTPATEEHDLPTHYCVDNFITINNKIDTKALVCIADHQAKFVCPIKEGLLYPTLLVVSTIFLGATLIIYFTLPDLRDKLHGRSLLSLVSAFFVAYILTAISYLTFTTQSSSVCTTLAFFKHLSLLAAFFWLNVMCFDIWRTLRKTRAVSGGRRSLHRFLWYSLYAWGCPLIIAIVAVVMEQQPASSGVIRPMFHDKFCWFSDTIALWVYFYGWVSLLLLANTCFFTMVMVILIKGQNNSLLRRSREMNRERMWLYVKLFLVMGITWLAEMMSYQHGKCVEWMFMDIINALEGFTLFLVFILNRTTLTKIRAKWCGAPPPALSPSNTLTSSISSHSKRQDSILSTTFKSSIISRKSTASSNLGTVELENTVPLNTLKESPDEGSDSHSSDNEEDETSHLSRGDGEAPVTVTRKDAASEET